MSILRRASNPDAERLSMHGALTALHIHRDGLPREERAEVRKIVQKLRDKLITHMRRIYRDDFAPERLVVIPHEMRDFVAAVRYAPNTLVTDGAKHLVNFWGSTVATDVVRWHGMGNSTNAATTAETALVEDMVAETTPANQRAVGTSTSGAAANIMRTVGTLTVWKSCNAGEWGLFVSSGTASTMWSRVAYTAIGLSSGDSVQFTYDLTI